VVDVEYDLKAAVGGANRPELFLNNHTLILMAESPSVNPKWGRSYFRPRRLTPFGFSIMQREDGSILTFGLAAPTKK
jgi:hypothetical protein